MELLKECHVMVNYDQSLQYMISQGSYSFVNAGISTRNFPSKQSGCRGVNILVVDFDLDVKSSLEAVRVAISQSGLRPVTLKELVSLGNQYPNLQSEIGNWVGTIQILSLDTALRHGLFSRTLYVPFLREERKRNELCLVWVDHDNPMLYCFAAVQN